TTSPGDPARRPVATVSSHRADLLPYDRKVSYRTNLDAAGPRPGKGRSDPDGFVHVVRLDEIEPRDDLLRFGERSIVNGLLPVADAHRLCRRRRPEDLGVEQPALLTQVISMLDATPHRLAELPRGQLVDQGFVTVDENHELHKGSPLSRCRTIERRATANYPLAHRCRRRPRPADSAKPQRPCGLRAIRRLLSTVVLPRGLRCTAQTAASRFRPRHASSSLRCWSSSEVSLSRY